MKLNKFLLGIVIAGGICLVLNTHEVNRVSAQERVGTSTKSNFKFPLLHRPYGIADQKVAGFESFQEIYLAFRPGEDWTNASVDAEGKVSLDGFVKLKDGTKYPFQTASLTREGNYFNKLAVATEPVGGIHYELTGRFFGKPQFRETYYVDMSGTLKKLSGKAVVLEREFEFFDVSDE